jgi:hypothetical protein
VFSPSARNGSPDTQPQRNTRSRYRERSPLG